MKIGIISKTNTKGQIVIPRAIRKQLGITANDFLHLFVRGDGLFIQPIKEVVNKADAQDNYLKILEKTKGVWGVMRDKERGVGKEKRAKELAASKKRKDLW